MKTGNSAEPNNHSIGFKQENILLAHGGGGTLMHRLIDEIFIDSYKSPELSQKHDGAVINLKHERIVMTTDSFVVDPLFFPGGDIGSLAVYGTVNDLAMCGAKPVYLSAAFIIEEGFAIEELRRIALSMNNAAEEAGVRIITGDTKVVDRGKGHGVFINTAGIGTLEHDYDICPTSIKQDDVIILNGDIGRHGIAVMAEREGLAFESEIKSDCAPLAGPVLKLINEGIEVHCLRDLTRGGLATALVEIAEASGKHLHINESSIPVREDIRGACEILGYDPLYVANEGRFIAFIREKDIKAAIDILQSDTSSPSPVVIGSVADAESGLVTMKSFIGAERYIEMLSGEQLPRIC